MFHNSWEILSGESIESGALRERKIMSEKALTIDRFVRQSEDVDRHAASQNLEVIRTLMERSAVYRRALAPIMLMLGSVGIGAGVLGYFLDIEGSRRFAVYWLGVSVAGLAGAYLQMRGQAIRDSEPFWSPPTKRVTQALAPALTVGAVVGIAIAMAPRGLFFKPPGLLIGEPAWQLPPVWMLLYGCAVHASGFFMPRGFKLFGWGFICAGAFVLMVLSRQADGVSLRLAHLLMAVVFGGAHLAYGIYLAITEKQRGLG
jgi:hypothetical protein